MSKIHIKKGDSVKVLTGDDKGKQGRILTVLVKKNRAIVEGLNMVTKHTKPNKNNQKGGIIKQEAAIHISNLVLLSKRSPMDNPSSAEPAKAERKRKKDLSRAKPKDSKLKMDSKKSTETTIRSQQQEAKNQKPEK